MAMKISLIHPSRSRPEKSYSNLQEWVSKKGDNIEWEVVLSLDRNDPNIEGYFKLYHTVEYTCTNFPHHQIESYLKTITENNNSVVEATNRAAKFSEGDILIYLSDDFKCPDNWGNSILKEFEGVTEPMILKVDDCLQKFDVPVLTIPIMNRALYERLGYFWNPEYKSMFCDEDLYWTARKLGALKFAPHLKFPHEHVSIGKAQDDETYRNSAKNWDQGKAVFAKRKASGFPV